MTGGKAAYFVCAALLAVLALASLLHDSYIRTAWPGEVQPQQLPTPPQVQEESQELSTSPKVQEETGRMHLMVPAKPSSPGPCSRLIFRHMSKCGGTYANALLSRVVSKGHYIESPDRFAFSWKLLKAAPTPFIIGSMRNPCNFYLSYASFHPEWVQSILKPGLLGWKLSARVPKLDPHSFSDNELYKWIAAIRENDTGLGWQSLTFWQHYHWDWKGSVSPKIMLKHLDTLPSYIDCWVFADALHEDLRECLKRFSQAGGNQFYDLQSFEHLVAHPETLPGKRNPYIERRQHKTCEQTFSNKTLEKLVLDSEHLLVRNFQIQQCCDVSDRRFKPSKELYIK